MAHGLQRGTVTIVVYDSEWPTDFEREKAHLLPVFGSEVVAIEHVGSTAVPGLSAKPIIDIEIGLRDFSVWQDFIDRLEALGYTFMPERVKPGEVFLPKGPEANRTHYLHIIQFGSPEWESTLLFRGKLRASKVLRKEYEYLKRQLALKFPDDRASYSIGKAEFIRRVISEGA